MDLAARHVGAQNADEAAKNCAKWIKDIKDWTKDEKLGLPQFPDGPFLPPMALNCAEMIFTAACKGLGWVSTHRRLAQLTRPHNGRAACHYCGNCVNGCDTGAMFNPIVVTIAPAFCAAWPRRAWTTAHVQSVSSFSIPAPSRSRRPASRSASPTSSPGFVSPVGP